MRLTVVGASGGIGRQLVRQAVAAGHQVTAVVRDSPGSAAAIREWEAAPAGGPGTLQVATVPALEAAALAGAVAGRDAVACALGPRGRGAQPTVNSRGVRAVTDAMKTAGVRRILAVSAAPVAPADQGPPVYRRVVRPLLWRIFGRHYADLVRMEQELRDSGLDWTVVRPPRLVDKPARGRVRTSVDAVAGGAATLARADVAAAMMRLLEEPGSIGQAIHLS